MEGVGEVGRGGRQAGAEGSDVGGEAGTGFLAGCAFLDVEEVRGQRWGSEVEEGAHFGGRFDEGLMLLVVMYFDV